MGFDLVPPLGATSKSLGGVRPELLQRVGCSACPLNHSSGITTPYMEASGAGRPEVYVLGEAPGGTEDAQGVPFVGPSGRYLREQIPPQWRDQVRYHNVIRCRPPHNRDPLPVEVECCRGYVTEDIEAAAPRAIFGFGAVPLHWLLQQNTIGKWRGRAIPVRVGAHTCWYFPMLHPAYVLHTQNEPRGEQIDFVFKLDLRNAFAMLETLPEPVVHSAADVVRDVAWVTGEKRDDCDRVLAHIAAMYQEDYVGLDYETRHTRPYRDDSLILTIALSGARSTLAWPLDHREACWSDRQRSAIVTAYETFLHEAPCRKISHSLAFEQEWSAVFFGKGCIRSGAWEDTISQAFVLDDRVRMAKPDALSLEVLGIQYFGINLKTLSGLDRSNLDGVALPQVLRYNGIDAKYHRLLFHAQDARLRAEGLQEVYEQHVSRVPTMVLAQIKGVPIDVTVVEELHNKYEARLHDVAQRIAAMPMARAFRERFQHDYRPAVPADGVQMLRRLLGVDAANADEEAFKPVRDPIGPATIEYRKLAKAHSTYVLPLTNPGGDVVLYPDGHLHPQITTCSTRTSRTACIRGGTRIQVPGGTKPIEQVRVGDWVYTYDENCRLALRRVTGTWYNGQRELVRVKWSSRGGTTGHLDVTPEHRVRLSSGEYCRADQLLVGRAKGASVLSLHRGQTSGYNILYRTGIAGGVRENRFVYAAIHGWWPEHVHHKDHDKRNDAPENLLACTARDHQHHHRKVIARETLLRALHAGNGVVGAMRLLQCDHQTLTRNLREYGIVATDGRTTNRVRPWQRVARGPYKGHAEYVDGYQSRYVNNHVVWSVTSLPGVHAVYDLAVDGSPCFIANDICVHNSDSPNIQNWPAHQGEFNEVRRQVHAPPGCKIVAVDYSGIQARNVAMESLDRSLVQAFCDRYDIHMDWATRVVDKYPRWVREGARVFTSDESVRKQYRQLAKNQFVFPTFFGAGGRGVSEGLGVPEQIAYQLQDDFWHEFPDIKSWHDALRAFYQDEGYVTGLSGYRRRAPVAYNELINTPIQADEAEIVCDAMSRLSCTNNDHLQAFLMVHDDLTFCFPEPYLDELADVVINTMVNVPFEWARCVPIEVEMKVGDDWHAMRKVAQFSSILGGNGDGYRELT